MFKRYKARTTALSARKLQLDWIAHHPVDGVRIGPPPKPKDIICLIVERDEYARMPDVLRHYRELGVDRFAILDNGSIDGTLEYLSEQPDVDLYRTEASYAEARSGYFWRSYMASRYGFNRWYMSVDADELVVYSGMDRKNLHHLREHLTSWKSKYLFAPLIDMYADRPLSELSFKHGDRMLDVCRFFDNNPSYQIKRKHNNIVHMGGGPRCRLVGEEAGKFQHSLRKYPFFLWDDTTLRRNTHDIESYGHREAPSGATLHFKFLPDFVERVPMIVERGQHWNGASQYKDYTSALDRGSLHNMWYEDSIEYKTPDSLAVARLMNRIHWESKRPARSWLKAAVLGRPTVKAVELLDR